MIPPMAYPPAKKTRHGAIMSPRLARLYTWLQDNQVRLNDFSTDQCVLREMPKLERLRDELAALIEVAADPWLANLAADLRNIMRRVPSARVAPTRKR